MTGSLPVCPPNIQSGSVYAWYEEREGGGQRLEGRAAPQQYVINVQDLDAASFRVHQMLLKAPNLLFNINNRTALISFAIAINRILLEHCGTKLPVSYDFSGYPLVSFPL